LPHTDSHTGEAGEGFELRLTPSAATGLAHSPRIDSSHDGAAFSFRRLMRRASSSADSAPAVGAIYAAGERIASRDARNSAMAGARPVGPRAADIRCRSVKGKLCSGKTRSRVGRRVENWVPVSLGSAARGPSYGLHPLGVAKPGLRLRPCRPVQALASRFW